MAESQNFRLEHFYYGIGASGTPEVLARSPGITPTHIAECQYIVPFEGAGDSGEFLALLPGETVEFVLAAGGTNTEGKPQIGYFLVPGTLLHKLAGDLDTLRKLISGQNPASGQTLSPLEISDARPMGEADQQKAIGELRRLCDDSPPVIQGILAAVVQGTPLAVTNAPQSLNERLAFIQGVLSLLPSPVRAKISFATHSQKKSGAQIKFIDQGTAESGHLSIDLAAGKLLSEAPQDTYSRVIVAGLQAEPDGIVATIQRLTESANWDGLTPGNAKDFLTWLVRRADIDKALGAKQPADPRQIGAVLQHDPTLPADKRPVYVRHLFNRALEGNEISAADGLPAVAAANREQGDFIARSLRELIEKGRALAVYNLLAHWLSTDVPQVKALPWHQILNIAAAQHLTGLLNQNQIPEATAFLNTVKDAAAALQMPDLLLALINQAQGPASYNADLARVVFLLAVDAMSLDGLRTLLGDERFTRQLPEPTQTALSCLQPQPRPDAPAGALSGGAQALDESYRGLVMARFAEMAAALQRYDLIDGTIIESLAAIAKSPYAARFAYLGNQIADGLSRSPAIHNFTVEAKSGLLQMLLANGRYQETINLLVVYQNKMDEAGQRDEYARLAGDAYEKATLNSTQLEQAIDLLEGSRVIPEARAMIYCGALRSQKWTDSQLKAAARLTDLIFNSSPIVRIIGFQNTNDLMEFHTRREDNEQTLKVAVGLVGNALIMGTRGAGLLVRIWDSITWEPRITRSSVELLRRYVRGVSLEDGRLLPDYFEKELGTDIGNTARAAYFMREVVPQADIVEFFADLHTATEFLVFLAKMFAGGMGHVQLTRALNALTGGIDSEDRQKIGANLRDVLQFIQVLGEKYNPGKGKKRPEEKFLKGEAIPPSGIDLLYAISGHFGDKSVIPLDLNQIEVKYSFRTTQAFLAETIAMSHLLSGLQTIPPTQRKEIVPEALAADLDSLWSAVSPGEQETIRAPLVHDCQILAQVIALISDQVTPDLLSDSRLAAQLESSQRQPVNVAEALRWMSGYFGKH